ncbi:MAG: hypothetical protein ACK5G7_02535 [Erysipelotrichaceae bacterium]
MIVVSLPQKREEVKEYIDKLCVENITYKVIDEKNIDLLVECDMDDEEFARKQLKKEIKRFVGTMIYFGIRVQ